MLCTLFVYALVGLITLADMLNPGQKAPLTSLVVGATFFSTSCFHLGSVYITPRRQPQGLSWAKKHGPAAMSVTLVITALLYFAMSMSIMYRGPGAAWTLFWFGIIFLGVGWFVLGQETHKWLP